MSNAFSEAMSGNRNKTIDKAVQDVMMTAERIQKAGPNPPRATNRTPAPKGADYSSAKRTERKENGVKTYGAPIGD